MSIENPRDYAILADFLRRGFAEEEDYGYVLEGIKPISIRNFQAIETFLIPNHLDWELLVHEAIPVWNRLFGQGRDFVFKVSYLSNPKSLAPGFELQFINVPRLREAIEDNISLFRYVLGPAINTEQLVRRIAYSDEPLCDVLKNDLTLVGIVLGFGLHNSLVGGKIEMLSNHILVRDEAPFLPQHRFFQNGDKQNAFLPEEFYRLYYLEFAGGNDSSFEKDRDRRLQPNLDFSGLEEESLPASLQEENPRFVFTAFKGGASNQALFDRLQQAQQWILALVKQENFLEEVLEKIGGEKPKIACAKPKDFSLFKHREGEWIGLLMNIAKRFEGEGGEAFINAFCQPTEASRRRPWAVGVSQATLQGLKKAQRNLAVAEKRFAALSQNNPSPLEEIVKGLLYAEITAKGAGNRVVATSDHIRVGYVVEDGEGAILFANHDVWLHPRETIPGFFRGVQAMQVGEKRTLFIHPALAYGALTTLPPCSSLTVKIHLLDIEEKTLAETQIIPLKPLDLTWINDPSLYGKIEASIQQIPRFVGSFYRDWLDKKSGLDITHLTAELKMSRKNMVRDGKNLRKIPL